jgi:sporulation protein YlmC with PRC-barrel domain
MTLQSTLPLALSANTLKGDTVKNVQGEDIGKVEEIMIDILTGRVAYVVVSFGGFLGIKNKLFAMPWSALRVDTDHKCFVMDADKELLKNAPGFDKNNWPEAPSGQWYHDVYKYYQQEPYWQG